ncbi:MAG: HAD-IIIA family hydrolase [Bacteroidetes bacterium]|nr:HAD-IIIA family hydrolase [Bacteroidota bacterium]
MNTRLKKIRLLLLDVDGVMTDGGIYLSNSGDEFKKFNIQDGYGITKLRLAGYRIGIITGRVSNIVARRAEELGITEVHQNLENKIEAYEKIIAKWNLADKEVAYIGDDEFDLPVLKRAGFSAAPSDAVSPVRKIVHYVCRRSGGNGAVREVIELILKNKCH